MGRILRIIGILVVIIVLAAVALVYLVPLDSLRGPIQAAASQATGRTVSIGGRLHIAIYPEIGVSAENVSISNIDGGRDPEFARVDDMILGVRLMPLLSRDVQVTKVLLQKPVIHLEVTKDGRANWEFETAEQDKAPQAQTSPATGSPKTKIGIDSVKITDGQITYYDARSNRSEDVSDANATLTLPALNAPASLDADFVYKMKKIDVNAEIADIESFLGEGITDASLNLSSDMAKLDFKGTIKRGGASSGHLLLSAPSLRTLTTWAAGSPIQTGGIDKLSLEGDVVSEDRRYVVSKATIMLDNMNIQANVAVDTKPEVPMVTGTLSADRLDFGPYLQGSGSGTGSADRNNKSGWSDEKIDLEGLKAVNANLTIAVGKSGIGKFVLDRVGKLTVTLQNGKLNADFDNVSLYGGTGSGKLAADSNGARPNFSTTINVRNVAMRPFLSTLINIDRIDGSGAVTIDVNAQGESEKEIIDNLSGSANMTVENGAIRGVDLAAIARTLQSTLTLNLSEVTGEHANTQFDEAAAHYDIRNGVMRNDDFRLLNPYIRILGKGDVDLARRNIDYHLEPRAAATRDGQTKLSLGGLGVPFHVHGGWDNIHYEPDVGGIAKGLMNNAGDGAAGIGGLLGNALGGNKSNNKNSDNGKRKSGGGLGGALKGLFGE